METCFTNPAIGLAGIFAFLLFSYLLITTLINQKSSSKNKKEDSTRNQRCKAIYRPPPVLGSTKPANITLGNLADTYGPILTVRIGMHPTLIVSNWEISKVCFTKNDKAFASLPRTSAAELLGYNFAMFGFSPCGPYWRHVRKIATLEILSNHRLEKLRHVRESKIRASIKQIHEFVCNNGFKPLVVEMKKWFWNININTVFKIVIERRYTEVETSHEEEENEQWGKAVRDFFDLTGTFTVADSLPFLRWLDSGGHEKAMKKM